MDTKTVTEKRNNNFKELDFARKKVENKKVSLRKNLEIINATLPVIKILKETRYCFMYLKKNWNNNVYLENELVKVENSLKDNLHLYEKTILERKILKAQLKQAQRNFSEKQKSKKRFYKKYYNR